MTLAVRAGLRMRTVLTVVGIGIVAAACRDDASPNREAAQPPERPPPASSEMPDAAADADATACIEPPRPPFAAKAPHNSLDTVDPNVVLPSIAALVPDGVSDTSEIPDTLDVAEMAAAFLDAVSKILLPENPYFHVPPGMVNMHGTPTAIFAGGAPNWGKTIQAMMMARAMSGHDLDDAKGTLTAQLVSARNMIDPNVNKNLIARGEGAWHVVTGALPENQMTTAVEALMELYRHNPLPDLGQLIQQMIAYHTKVAVRGSNADGQPMMHYRLPVPGVSPYVPSSIGSLGYGDWPFHVGKTMRALSTWYLRTGDAEALESTILLSAFVRNYSGHVFWSVPPGFPEGQGTGHFAGHIHMFANGLMGLLWEAEARLRRDAADPVAAPLIDFVKKSYFYIRDMHGGAQVALGNFGEICALADMLRLAVKLTELGAGDFNEDIERWIRNQTAESQIRGAITIESHPENPLKDRIGEKVIGLFFEDATHPLAIPDTPNGQGDLTLQLVACGLGNVIHGIFDVWEHIIEVEKDLLRVNLLLNRASWYLDVTSEIPYRGAVNLVTRADLGPIRSLDVRIPDGVDHAQVRIVANGAPVAYGWANPHYIHLTNIQRNTRYTVMFPLMRKQMAFKQVRNQSQNWVESSYSPDPGTGQDYAFHADAPENTYVGTFRGNTLVGVDHWPSGGIGLYRGQDRAFWSTLGSADAATTPTHLSRRFRLRPKCN